MQAPLPHSCRRHRSRPEVIDTPMLAAVADVLLYRPHRWKPKGSRKSGKPGSDGRLTAKALDALDEIARAIATEFKTPTGHRIPEDPVERSCLIAAGSYLALIGGAPFHDEVLGAAIANSIRFENERAQRQEASESGRTNGGRDFGEDNDKITASIDAIIRANPGKSATDLVKQVYADNHHRLPRTTTDKAIEQRIRRRLKVHSAK